MVSVAVALLAGGCGPSTGRPEECVGFFLRSRQDVLRTRRAVLVELGEDRTCEPQVAWHATQALAQAIQAKGLFHVDVVRRGDSRCRDLDLDNMEALTLEELAEMRQALRCDAVLFGRVSHYRPFPKMQLGLYLKLMNLRNGLLVWGVDHLWDTTDRQTARRIQAYFRTRKRAGYDPLGWELVLKSPRAFERYVADEVADTLPSRDTPVRTASARPGPARAPRRSPRAQKTPDSGQIPLSSLVNPRR